MTESSMTPVVRHGRIEDMPDLNFDEIYDEMDYLSSRYKTYCEDPWRINYILEVGGVTVSSLVATVVDAGEGVVFMAARTHPDHRNRGYQYFLKEAAVKELKAIYPKLKEVLYIPWATIEPTDQRRELSATHFHASKLTNLEIIKEKLESYEHATKSSVQSVEFGKISTYLKREDFRRHFPADRMIIEWVPYRLDIPSNFSMAYRFPDTFQVTFDQQGLIDGVSFRSVYLDKERDWERLDVEIYCATEETCLKHCAAFFQGVLKSKSCTDLFSFVNYPDCFDQDNFNATLKKMFGLNDGKAQEKPKVQLILDNKYFV